MLQVRLIESGACWRSTRWIRYISAVICCSKCRQSINELNKPPQHTGTPPGSIVLWVINTSEIMVSFIVLQVVIFFFLIVRLDIKQHMKIIR